MRRPLLILLAVAVCAAAIASLIPFTPSGSECGHDDPPGYHETLVHFFSVAIPIHIAAAAVLLLLLFLVTNERQSKGAEPRPAHWPLYAIAIYLLLLAFFLVQYDLLDGRLNAIFFLPGLAAFYLAILLAIPALLLFLALCLLALAPERSLRDNAPRYWRMGFRTLAVAGAFVLVPGLLFMFIMNSITLYC